MEGRAANATQLQRYTEKWQELAEKLNQFEGAKKNLKQWKETLNDFKANVKRKARAKQLEATGTGGGPSSGSVLGPLEEKLLGLMSQTVISGCPEVVEAGFGSSGEPAAPELDISDLVKTIFENAPSTI
ncbi:hypothetical protein MTP99_006854 [Tenebrio molitor]|nr:hypothetical protein MTP99_006854 [Tenebrio molitor]